MKTAFVFPGQGSQSIMMMAPFADVEIAKDTFGQASEILGQDLWHLVNHGPVEELNQTINTQPVMLTASVAMYRAWVARGGKQPDIVAGHSLGEYAALVVSGVLDFHEAIEVVRFRAQLMTEVMPTGGAMAAVLGLDQAVLAQVCEKAAKNEVVEMVNFNDPKQIVIAGHQAAVERAGVLAKESGAKRVVMLPVSGPFHSSLMKGAADQMASYLMRTKLLAPATEIIMNVDAEAHDNIDDIRQLMSRQICSPVQWVDTIKAMESMGVDTIIECGPGKILTGLGKRISPDMQHLVLSDPQVMDNLIFGDDA